MTTTAATLREQLETLQRAHKGAHMSDLARSLNLTEGQLIATGCDTGEAVRLEPRPLALGPTVNGVVWTSIPRSRKCCSTDFHAPRAVMPIALWS